MMQRTIINPIVKDKVSFIQMAHESEGKSTHFLVELNPEGASGIHFHDQFSEEFICKEGKLELRMGKEKMLLDAGASFIVAPFVVHHFFNPCNHPILFEVKLTPGNRNFEEFLQIMYGLARDGKTNKAGLPLNPLHLLAISTIAETYPPPNSFLGIISKVIIPFAKFITSTKTLDRLRTKYVEF